MQNICLEKLEFNKIKNILSEYAVTSKGKNLCLDLIPSTVTAKIQKALSEVAEAVSLIYRNGNLPINELPNIESHILALKSQNFLSIKSLLETNKLLITSRELKDYFFGSKLYQSESLTNYFDHLYVSKGIEDKINSAIIDENTLDDHASEKLYQIRKQIKDVQRNIKNKLQSLLNSKYLQEPIITLRQNRSVVPVKAEYQSQIKGFIHDVSASGSTVFIEPLSVFDLNNSISDLKNQENIEIEKILQTLSALFFDITDELENTYNLIGLIDFIFAKAKYSKHTNCSCPKLSNEKAIYLKNAIHPLLDPQFAVPINIEIGKSYNTLLITGPNTGGKTVTLKTVGLLVAMAQAGMHIPASEGSCIYVFDNIFADIGDDQSISESLSTFSSHMKNIVNIVNQSTSDSLVLVDELGSGTDPIEGSALALSILERFRKQNTLTLATTHYNELKQYALVTDGVENASLEFNLETLSPTYRLLLGVPGKSNAFAISKKLGLATEIIENAESLIGEDTAKIEDILKEIYDSKAQIEVEKENILKQSKEINNLKQKLSNEYEDISSHKKEYLQKSKQEARKILLDAKEEANEIIKEIEQEKHNSKNINKLRNKLNDNLLNLNNTEENETKVSAEIPEAEILPELEVYVPSFNQNGIILSKPNQSKKVNIQIGIIKTSLFTNQITYAKKLGNKKQVIQSKRSNFSPPKIETELKIIGMNIEESIFLVDKFLDNASLSRLEQVRIVHGKGTGTLGKGIQAYLKTHPHVKSYRYGTFGEGEMGVTIVELK